MPTPVPPGRFAEYAACLSEGFCPSCRRPLHAPVRLAAGHFVAFCDPCGCRWEYDQGTSARDPQICWRGTVPTDGTTDGITWEIWTRDDDPVAIFGTAEWAE